MVRGSWWSSRYTSGSPGVLYVASCQDCQLRMMSETEGMLHRVSKCGTMQKKKTHMKIIRFGVVVYFSSDVRPTNA